LKMTVRWRTEDFDDLRVRRINARGPAIMTPIPRVLSGLRTPLAAVVLTLLGCLSASGSPATDASCCNVLELRQYTLRPGTREPFIELFDNLFADPLDSTGMTVVGEFRDLDRPNRFVWIRGFQDMPARATELAAFYGGDLWHAHRDEANAAIEDSDNVLLLEPASAALRFSDIPARPVAGDAPTRAGFVVVTLYYTKADRLGAFAAQFDKSLRRLAEADGARTLAAYVTSSQENNYPKLPVRSGEHIFVWVSTFVSSDAYGSYQTKLTSDKSWTARWNSARTQLTRDPEVLRLTPTARSRLRG
jgi:hypothetical protein